MRKEDQIYQNICEVAGIENGRLDGVPVYFSVKEIRCKTRSSVWKTEPSGRYQINVSVPNARRERIFRTKLKDGSYDILGVVDAIKLAARQRRVEMDRELARQANKDVAESIRSKYKLNKTYVSSYAGSAGSFCAPAPVEGLVNVQINFGAVDPAIAEKIMAFAQSLGA